MPSSPQLSIIIPVYNVAPYLRRCLDSIVHQTLRDIEIICVDDGSTDDSPAILAEFAARDERIIIITKKNGGLSSARNAGLEAAHAEWIAFVDSDDSVEPHTYEQAIACMTEGVDLVIFGIQVHCPFDAGMQQEFQAALNLKYSGKQTTCYELIRQCGHSAWNKIYKRDLIRQHQLQFPDYLRYEDTYFFYLYALYTRSIFFLPDYLYHYHIRQNSIMGDTYAQKKGIAIQHVSIAERFYSYCFHHKLLEQHDHYVGSIIMWLIDQALIYEHDASERRITYICAENFLALHQPTFLRYADLAFAYDLLHAHIRRFEVKRLVGGLIKIKQSDRHRKYFFCGLPIWRITFQNNTRRAFLLSALCVSKKTYKAPLYPIQHETNHP